MKSAKTTAAKSASPSRKAATARSSPKKSIKSKATTSPKSRVRPKATPKPKAKKQSSRKAKLLEFTKPPKKPITSFLLFLADGMPKFSNTLESRAYTKDGAAKWRAMSDEEKEPYVTKGQEIGEKYKKAREEWLKSTSVTGLRQHRKLARARKAKKALKDSEGQPIKPPPTTFQTFFREHKEEFKYPTDKNSDNLERMKRAARAWQALGAQEKAIYQKRYNEAMAGYRKLSEDIRAHQ